MRAGVLAGLALTLAAGCASSTSPPPEAARPETVRIVNAGGGGMSIGTSNAPRAMATKIARPVADVWAVVPQVLESIPIPVDHLDHNTRTAGNSSLKLRRRLGKAPVSRYLDCGTTQAGPNADSYEVLLSVMVETQPADGQTQIRTSVQGLARPVLFAGDYIRCQTTDELERYIAKLIGERLGQPGR